MGIPDIGVRDIGVRINQIPDTPDWLLSPPQAIPPVVPVTETIGVPIINIPGCVEAHEQQDGKNQNIRTDDEAGVRIYCDGQQPSFNPILFEPDQILKTPVPKVDTRRPEDATPELKVPEIPKPPIPPLPKQECPTREQQLKNPVGKILEGDTKITGYELVGKECLMVTEPLTIPDQIVGNIPNAGLVTATASIALVATTSALLAKPFADLLLKVVKPVTKKVVKKIATLRGKNPPVLSVKDRQDEQRQRSAAIRVLRSVFPKRKKKG